MTTAWLWLASNWPWLVMAVVVALCVCVPAVAAFLFGTKPGRVIFLVVVVLGGGYWLRTSAYADGWQARDATAKAEAHEWKHAAAMQVADATLAETVANRKAENARVDAINAAAAAYEKGKKDAHELEARTVADLRAGNVRLREQWRGCEVARSAAGAAGADSGIADAADELRRASAGRIVRIVATCQAERDALLKIAEDDRRAP